MSSACVASAFKFEVLIEKKVHRVRKKYEELAEPDTDVCQMNDIIIVLVSLTYQDWPDVQ